MITGNLNVIPDARVRNIISKGPKHRFPSNIDFPKCRREIAASLNDFSKRWWKQGNVEPNALKEWKINIFKIIDAQVRIQRGGIGGPDTPPPPGKSHSYMGFYRN